MYERYLNALKHQDFMTVKDDLHQLIQSMSRTEKRYFKVQAKKSGDEQSNYVRLFNAINSQDSYNEEAIKKKFKKEKLGQNLHKEKVYLYRKLLQSLRAYRTEKSADAQIKDMLIDVAYLIERSLYQQAESVIRKAKQKAYDYEKYIALLQILDAERNIINKLQTKNVNELVQENHQARNEVLKIIHQENEYQQLESELFSLSLTKFSLRSEEELKRLDKYREHPLFLNESLPLSFQAKAILYKAKAAYYILINDRVKTYETYEKALELWRVNPKQQEEKPYAYRMLLSNYLYGCFAIQKWDNFLPTIKAIHDIPAKNKDDEAVCFYQTHYNELLYYMNIAAFDKAVQLAPAIEEGLNKYKDTIKDSTRIGFYNNLGILFFVQQDWKTAQKWFNKIIKYSRTTTRLDLQSQARIYNLIIEYELGNYDILDDLHRSISRFLKNRDIKYKLESVMLTQLKQLFKLFNKTDIKKHFQTFQTLLNELQQDEFERNAGGLEEYALWVVSKLKRQPMSLLLKEK